MSLIFVIFLVLAVLIILVFTIALRIKFVFDSDKTDMKMTLRWLDPFVRALIKIEESQPILTVFLFNKEIFKKTLVKGGNGSSGVELIKLAEPKDVHVNIDYGFSDPFMTGITTGAINIASQFINIDSIRHTPNFLPENDYIHLDATARVNLGSTLLKLFNLSK